MATVAIVAGGGDRGATTLGVAKTTRAVGRVDAGGAFGKEATSDACFLIGAETIFAKGILEAAVAVFAEITGVGAAASLETDISGAFGSEGARGIFGVGSGGVATALEADPLGATAIIEAAITRATALEEAAGGGFAESGGTFVRRLARLAATFFLTDALDADLGRRASPITKAAVSGIGGERDAKAGAFGASGEAGTKALVADLVGAAGAIAKAAVGGIDAGLNAGSGAEGLLVERAAAASGEAVLVGRTRSVAKAAVKDRGLEIGAKAATKGLIGRAWSFALPREARFGGLAGLVARAAVKGVEEKIDTGALAALESGEAKAEGRRGGSVAGFKRAAGRLTDLAGAASTEARGSELAALKGGTVAVCLAGYLGFAKSPDTAARRTSFVGGARDLGRKASVGGKKKSEAEPEREKKDRRPRRERRRTQIRTLSREHTRQTRR